jgi:DNA (cytosine-5)-methyltransferase 1
MQHHSLQTNPQYGNFCGRLHQQMISTAELSNGNGRSAKHGSVANSTSFHAKSNGSIARPVVADFCSGMGGLSLAAQQLGMQIVAGVDLNAAALRTFKKNFPAAEAIEGSVRSPKILKRCAELFGDSPSVVISGPPCQGFSVAGSRDPADPRNQVLAAVARAIVNLTPNCALIENVAMILSEDHDDRLSDFENILFDGGYSVCGLLLNAEEFGVPQKRKRAFFLITRCELSKEDVYKRLEKLKQTPVIVKAALRGLRQPIVRPDDYNDEHDYGNIPNHVAMQHSRRVMDKIAKIKPGTGPMSYRRLHPERPSNTLFSGHRAPPAHYSQPRSITVREAARLQGFPDDFRIYGSFGKQMEQVTNAVPPPLAKAVLSVLAEMAGIPVCLHG